MEQLIPRTNASTTSRRMVAAQSLYGRGAVIGPDEGLYGGSLAGQYWHVLRRHIWSIIGITVLGVAAGVAFSLLQVRTYRAHAVIQIQGLNDNFLNLKALTPVEDWSFSNAFDDVQTHIRMIQSRTLLERVIDKMNIREPNDLGHNTGRMTIWSKPADFGKSGSDEARQMALAIASKSLSVRGIGRTRMVEVAYEGTDPQIAARLVNTVIEESIARNTETRWQMNRQTREWINGQLEDLQNKLKASEDALKAYAQRSGLVILSETSNVSEDKLRRLQEELIRAQADRIWKEARYKLTKNTGPESMPDVLKDGLLKDYQAKLAVLRQQQAELSTAYTPEYSKVKRIDAQIASIESDLKRHRNSLIEQIRNEYEEAVGREELLLGNYAIETRNLANEGAKAVTYGMLKRELDSNRQLYDAMLQRTKEAGVTSAIPASTARVIDPAVPPRAPSTPPIVLNAAIGFVGSLIAGLLVVAFRESTDRSIRHPGELRSYLSIDELGVIRSAKGHRWIPYRRRERQPYAPTLLASEEGIVSYVQAGGRKRAALMTSVDEYSVLAQSMRSVLASRCFSDTHGRQPSAVVVTSPEAGEGKTTIASNLAIALTAIHERVLLIDGDMHKPRVHEVFGVRNIKGLSELLSANTGTLTDALLDSVQKTAVPGLFVLAVGSQPAGNVFFRRSALTSLLQDARVHFNTIVIDAPPVLDIADARVLGRCADGVILVARAGTTTKQAAMAAHQRLADDGINVLGTILNDWDPKVSPREYFG